MHLAKRMVENPGQEGAELGPGGPNHTSGESVHQKGVGGGIGTGPRKKIVRTKERIHSIVSRKTAGHRANGGKEKPPKAACREEEQDSGKGRKDREGNGKS